jgi:hypothetical protein
VAGPRDHDPGQRRADLPGQEALGLGQGAGGRLDVGVVEDDGGGLAAEFQGAAGDPLAADRGDPPSGRGRPGEGDLVDPRVADEQLGDLAVGGDHVDHAGRQADRLGRLREEVPLARRLRRVLEDHGAPGQQRGRDLVADQPDRRVPRDDRADDADRLADEQAELPDRRLGGLLERERARQAANPLKVRSAPMPPPRATAASTPDSRGQIWPMSLGALLQLRADRAQVLGPLLVSQPWPRAVVERLAGRADRAEMSAACASGTVK